MTEPDQSDQQPADLVPPYDDRTSGGQTESQIARAESVERQLSDTEPGNPGATTSPADELPVGDDEGGSGGAPDSPKGVGVSENRGGEEVLKDEGQEPGRHRAGTQGATERPVGISDERDSAGIDPQSSSQDAPTTPAGDQGG